VVAVKGDLVISVPKTIHVGTNPKKNPTVVTVLERCIPLQKKKITWVSERS
jgi:hypothetical protein